jgi:hypothetical protein
MYISRIRINKGIFAKVLISIRSYFTGKIEISSVLITHLSIIVLFSYLNLAIKFLAGEG